MVIARRVILTQVLGLDSSPRKLDSVSQQKRALRQLYLAYNYQFEASRTDPLYRVLYSQVSGFYTTNCGAVMLDYGCGAGRMIYDLSAFYKKAKIIGIDENPYVIEWLRKLVCSDQVVDVDFSDFGKGRRMLPCIFRDNIELSLRKDFQTERFREKVDLVLLSYVLDEVESPDNLMKELYNLIKQDGRILVATPMNPKNPRLAKTLGSLSSLESFFKKHGLCIESCFQNYSYSESVSDLGSWTSLPTTFLMLTK